MFFETGFLKHWLFAENIECCAYDFCLEIYRQHFSLAIYKLYNSFRKKATGSLIAYVLLTFSN